MSDSITRHGHFKLDTTQEFNWPKRVRCNLCGQYVKRGVIYQAEHHWEKHTTTVVWKPLSKESLDEFLRDL